MIAFPVLRDRFAVNLRINIFASSRSLMWILELWWLIVMGAMFAKQENLGQSSKNGIRHVATRQYANPEKPGRTEFENEWCRNVIENPRPG